MVTDWEGPPLKNPGPPVPTGPLGTKNQKKYEGRMDRSIQPLRRVYES